MNIVIPLSFKKVKDNYYHCLISKQPTSIFIIGDISRLSIYDSNGIFFVLTGTCLLGRNEITVDSVIQAIKDFRNIDLSTFTPAGQAQIKKALR
ncbi:MAG: pyrrolidone-carboxylate peptidase [Psychroserpens sp.]|jgi:pyrrolidone-carboxylate peptidase